MPAITWTQIGQFAPAAGDILEPWVVVPVDIPDGATRVKFVAEGKWKTINSLESCGADGMTTRDSAADQLVITDCAMGALIGRFGGSTAALKAPDAETDQQGGATKPFPVGSQTIVKVPANYVGPLLLSFNILRRPVKVESLKVTIFAAG